MCSSVSNIQQPAKKLPLLVFDVSVYELTSIRSINDLPCILFFENGVFASTLLIQYENDLIQLLAYKKPTERLYTRREPITISNKFSDQVFTHKVTWLAQETVPPKRAAFIVRPDRRHRYRI
jgi:hypothetical protein